MSHQYKKIKLSSDEENLCINTIRMLSADQPSAGKSGHPGAPMGCAPMAHVLFGKVMNYNPSNPKWSNRDRFVLSNGHACALQYSMLHMSGYDLTVEDLKKFRNFGSKTPGHPENFCTDGVEVSTGPLGQGISNAVGLAIAEKHLAATFNKSDISIIDHFTYVICGDGCLQEGVSSEACSLAGHLGLGKLIVLYDDNQITIDGHTDISFTEDVAKRFEAYNWHVQTVIDGNYDHKAIHEAVLEAKKVTDKPSLIKIRTIIGLGSAIQDTHQVHGAPLKPDDLANTKKKYGLDPEKFFQVPDSVSKFYNKKESGNQLESEWNSTFNTYKKKYPELAKEFIRRLENKLPEGWKDALPKYKPESKSMATRNFSELCLNALAGKIPELMGGSADLTPSNLTKIDRDFQKATPTGRYLRFGVREHAMAAICNGLFAHGGIRPFCATFYNFIGYALGAVRVSALSRFGVLYIATHDSIFLGEDGPTHQPIEMNPSLRAMPNMYVFRPADGNEVSGAYAWALENPSSTSLLALTRQEVPNLKVSSWEKVYKGAYVAQELDNGCGSGSPDLIFVATGSEVGLALEAAVLLMGKRVRVVSMPCRDLFDQQSLEYKKSLLSCGVPVISVEAASTFGWSTYSHAQFGLDRFGASGSIADLRQQFGFTPQAVSEYAQDVLNFYDGRSVPCLFDVPLQRHLVINASSTH